MADYLEILTHEALKTIESRYYLLDAANFRRQLSLKEAILKCKHVPVIAEIKPSSPSKGKLRQINNPVEIAEAMRRGGAIGISILTEPKHFNGSLQTLAKVCGHVEIPVLMKDIILDPVQLEAAHKAGAHAVLLIYKVFSEGYSKFSLNEMIKKAHNLGLEVLLETHTMEEFVAALETDADLIGINNRDLATLRVDLKVTEFILSNVDCGDKIVVSESGIQSPEDIRRLKRFGAKAFLVGSALMEAENIEEKVKELVMTL
ncbi:indole-3-glycerol-phosphate synthase [Candidatus Bathyarchaeota archaeon]|nr:indole-3-glycerol-phosphate synthase [Candidatus Bathyarchaeota archaeon]